MTFSDTRSNGKNHFRHMPRTLVIGGAGFIGSHVVEALLAQGHTVRVLDNLSTGKLHNLPLNHPDLELKIGSILDYETVQNAMFGMRTCVMLAAQVSAALSVEFPYESATSNILGFINVLQSARALRLHRLVYASSAAIYGDCSNLPLQESEIAKPVNPYGLEKHVDELYADLYGRQYDLNTLGLRFFNVYGPRQDPSSPYSGVISKFLQKLSANRPPQIFGDGEQTRDFIHVSDVARACLKALDSDYRGVCNVATEQRVDLLRMVKILGEAIGTSVEPEFGAARIGDIRHSCGSAAKLQDVLQYSASVSLEQGLTELADDYQRQRASAAAGSTKEAIASPKHAH